TVEALDEARPQWNAARPWLADSVLPGRGATFTWLAGVRTGLKPGDAVLLVDDDFTANPEAGGDRWDLRLLTRVDADAEADRTRVEWSRGLGSARPFKNPAAEPRLYALRRRASAFGHNAPMWQSMPAVFKEQYPGGGSATIGFAPDWPAFNVSAKSPGASVAWLDLDSVVSEAAAGSLAVVAKGEFNRSSGPAAGSYVELYKVRGNSEVSRAQFALSGKVTRLELAGENFAAQFFDRPRELTVFLLSERLDFAAHPVITPVSGEWLPLDLPADGLHAGRRIVVRGERVSDGAAVVHRTTVRSVTAQGTRCTLRLDSALPAALKRDSVVVHLNVALASHGETTTQILGSGDAATPFQRFELKQLPLTWRAAASEAGASPEITLRVGELRWTPRETMYGAARDERAYALRDDEQGRMWVEFGDGEQGARLPSGQSNVRATYRSGIGAAGNVRAETLTQLGSRPLGLKGVANPLAASGGTDPEAAADARRNMPLATRTLGRVVSLLDYEDFARAYAGIAKAQAAVLALPRGRCIVLTVAAPEGSTIDETSPVWTGLLAALKAAGDPLVPVQLLAAQRSPLQVGLRVHCDAERDEAVVLAAVEQALREDFGFAARELGQPVQRSAVLASAHRVPGVRAVQLTDLFGGSAPAAQTLPGVHERLLANRMRVGAGGVPLAAELLTLEAGPLARLEVLP
ncbi:MAG: putative baseplate assembly protein, partial [Rubrivivax sp.]|nr:putative baseplate assembly protein [Rubrivivax sp.]